MRRSHYYRLIAGLVGGLMMAMPAAAQEAGPDTTEALPLQTTRTIAFTTDEGTWIDLDVSPDGRTIVFELLGDLYTIPMSGGKATRITSGIAYDAQPRFSPGGERIVFVSDRNGGENVWLANADGGEPEMLTSGMTNRFQSPEWTPDGHIVVSKGRGGSRGGGFPSRRYDQRAYDIMLYDLRGGKGIKLDLGNTSSLLGAAFGSDPRYLYVSSSGQPRPGGWRILLLDRETGRRRRSPAMRAPRCAPRSVRETGGSSTAHATIMDRGSASATSRAGMSGGCTPMCSATSRRGSFRAT